MYKCNICGNELKGSWRKQKKTCDDAECKKAYKKKRWKEYRKKVGKKYKYDGNRIKAFERDKFTCQICGSKENLVCHHKDYSGLTDNPNHNLDNLITLCSTCHTSLHHSGAIYAERLVIICLNCNKEFTTERKSRLPKYCGNDCRIEHRKKQSEISHKRNCETCGKEFINLKRFNHTNNKYCSRECWINKSSVMEIVQCEICGNDFSAYPYKIKEGKAKYCSKPCQYKGMALKFKK